MAIIDARYYSTSLPPQGNTAGGVAGTRTGGQTALQRGHAPADMNWPAFGESGSHRVITVNTTAGEPTGKTIDILVNSILSHIGSRVTPGQ